MQSPYSAADEPLDPNASNAPVSTAAIGEAWEKLKPTLPTWIGVAVVYLLILGALGFVQTLLQTRDAQGLPHQDAVLAFLSISGFGGLAISGRRTVQSRHQPTCARAAPSSSNSSTSFDVAAPLFIAAVLTTIVTGLGLALCIIPGILVSLGLSMTNPLIIDQKSDAIQAMRRSWEVCKDHLGALFLLGIVLTLVNLVGACACGTGHGGDSAADLSDAGHRLPRSFRGRLVRRFDLDARFSDAAHCKSVN